MAVEAVEISLIIPTLNESANLPLLLPRIAAALRGRRYEVIVVDDNSRDDTVAVCEQLAREHPLKLMVRTEPKNGLSGAVLHGMAEARGECFVVMDADLQHPPEKLPALIEPVERGDAEFSIGSRYVEGASTAERWGFFRQINSWVATLLARPFAGRTRDPMSGFFALRRTTYQRAERLTPLGYKIALELMCKCRVKSVREIPIHFDTRAKGESKLTLKQQFRYLEHLSRLYDFFFPRASPVIKFLIVVTLSWLVALGVYLILLYNDVSPAMAPVVAYPAAIFVTAVFHWRYVKTQREFLVRRRPWMDFLIIALAEWAVCAMVAAWIAARAHGAAAMEVFLITFGCATITRYALRKEFLQDIRGLRREVRRDDAA